MDPRPIGTLDLEAQMNDMNSDGERKLVTLCTVENSVEASVLEGLLADRSIPAVLETWQSSALDGLFVQHKGHARMKVFEEDLAGAQQVLADFRTDSNTEPGADL